MARPKELKLQKTRVVYAEESVFKYLKSNGIPITGFFRQAYAAHKNKEWTYKH